MILLFSGSRESSLAQGREPAAPKTVAPPPLDGRCNELQQQLSTSLDNVCHNCTSCSGWSKKQKRAYRDLNSGFSKHSGEIPRFLTLTSSDDALDPVSLDFRILVLRIRRMTPARLVREGYLKELQLRKFYPGKSRVEPLKFEYCKIETSEGNGVLHVVYFGDYIPQRWLSAVWGIVHQSPIVDVRKVTRRDRADHRLARYVVAQYCSGQSRFVRHDSSVGWVFRGFVAQFRRFLKSYGFRRGLELWAQYLEQGWLWVQGVDPPGEDASGAIFGYSAEESLQYRTWRGVRGYGS